ncbi:MAG TPA: DUF2092 domain-containing protein [Candidatus Acidoferrales bacterium]|nr:DUF2092 domain-containing protein [Candidatus Acidoferrales bacterium]
MRTRSLLRLKTFILIGGFWAGSGLLMAQTAPPATSTPAAQPAAKKKATAKAKAEAPPALTLEPKAIEILKAVGSRLALAHTISFTAVETFESLSRQGVPLVYANRSLVTLERPNKLRIIQTGDGPASEFYYDGKIMMAYAPVENLVAIADAPGTIDDTLETIFHTAGIYFPFTDIIVADPYGDMAPGLLHAYYVGQSNVVGGTTTDIVACAADGVFMELWIGVEDKLPRAIHAIYLDDPDQLRHNLLLSDWQIDSPVSAEVFTTTKAAGARHMQFAHPHPEPPPGARPPAGRTAPAKTNPTNPAAKPQQ